MICFESAQVQKHISSIELTRTQRTFVLLVRERFQWWHVHTLEEKGYFLYHANYVQIESFGLQKIKCWITYSFFGGLVEFINSFDSMLAFACVSDSGPSSKSIFSFKEVDVILLFCIGTCWQCGDKVWSISGSFIVLMILSSTL